MPLTEAEALSKYFDTASYQTPPKSVAITDGVHDSALTLAKELGMETLDLRGVDPAEAIHEIERRRVFAVLGRGGMDNACKKGDPETFWRVPTFRRSNASQNGGWKLEVESWNLTSHFPFRTSFILRRLI